MSEFDTMPKVELHVHLEGAIPLEAMWELVRRRGFDSGVSSKADLLDRYRYTDFANFIDTWVWKNQFLADATAFELAAESVASSLARQNIVYAEMFFSPTDFRHHGLGVADIALAIRRGLDRVPATPVALIADLVRDTGPVRAAVTLDAVRDVAADAGIIGIGIGGSEDAYPPELFTEVYREARNSGLHVTAHAGEAAGPESVRRAIDALGVERIGHGIRAAEDPALMRDLVRSAIPLELCPTSNVCTGVVGAMDDHPAWKLIDAGVMATINTDDPAMFHTTLAAELDLVASRFDAAIIERLAHNAIGASWADADHKTRLHRDLSDWWAAGPRTEHPGLR